MELSEQLEKLVEETDECIVKCGKKFTNIDGALKLSRKFLSEKKFLLTLLKKKQEIKEVHLKSSNLRHLKAIVNQIDVLENVTSVLKIFKDKSHNVLTVDVVCDFGYTWVKAVARNAQSLHLIWAGEGQYGEKSITNQINEYIKFAECNTHNYKVPKIVFYFAGGVTREMANYLRSRNISVNGEEVELDELTKQKLSFYDEDDSDDNDDVSDGICVNKNVVQEQEQEQELEKNKIENNDEENPELLNKYFDMNQDINKINLDVTTLIALVSELTNGSDDYIFKQQFLTRQAEWERTQHLIPVLEDFMKGKELLVCETAYADFMNIVNTVGGIKERERAKSLLERLKVIPDSPTERVMQLKESSKIKTRAKIIFGTGDNIKAITMTSNVGFVRAAIQQDTKLPCFAHQSRALTEKKQLNAKKIILTVNNENDHKL